MAIIKIKGLIISYSPFILTIYDSYTVTTEQAKYKIYEEILNKIPEYETKRSIKSFVDEWEVHNLFWNLKLFRKHTKDCDFESNQFKFLTILYKILAIIARKVNQKWKTKN